MTDVFFFVCFLFFLPKIKPNNRKVLQFKFFFFKRYPPIQLLTLQKAVPLIILQKAVEMTTNFTNQIYKSSAITHPPKCTNEPPLLNSLHSIARRSSKKRRTDFINLSKFKNKYDDVFPDFPD